MLVVQVVQVVQYLQEMNKMNNVNKTRKNSLEHLSKHLNLRFLLICLPTLLPKTSNHSYKLPTISVRIKYWKTKVHTVSVKTLVGSR